jgi:hypothetical protein
MTATPRNLKLNVKYTGKTFVQSRINQVLKQQENEETTNENYVRCAQLDL